jgi:nitrogen fixation protein
MTSLRFLGLEPAYATVYVAGNHWKEDIIKVAQSSAYGFGILTVNGKDLDVLDPPIPPPA